MQKHFFKFKKVFTNIACYPLLFISNNLELSAKFLPKKVEDSITTLEINKIKNGSYQYFNIQREKNLLKSKDNNINKIGDKIDKGSDNSLILKDNKLRIIYKPNQISLSQEDVIKIIKI